VVVDWDALPDGPAPAEHAETFNRRLRMQAKALD
jgi:hypothetical protein